jgi:hypothetical protein
MREGPVASGRIARSWSPAKSIDEVFWTGSTLVSLRFSVAVAAGLEIM